MRLLRRRGRALRASLPPPYFTTRMGHCFSVLPHPGHSPRLKRQDNLCNLRDLIETDDAMNAKNELSYVLCLIIPALLAAAVYTNLAS